MYSIILHAIVIMTIDLASLQSPDGARRVFAGPGSDVQFINSGSRTVYFCAHEDVREALGYD